MKDRYLCIAKIAQDGKTWIIGYYYYADYLNDSHRINTSKGMNFEIDYNTLCQCAKSTKRGRLWEGDMFWDSYEDGVIGVIDWNETYDGWLVDLIPNISNNEIKPDFTQLIESLTLEEYSDNNYVWIHSNLIGNKHDYGYIIK